MAKLNMKNVTEEINDKHLKPWSELCKVTSALPLALVGDIADRWLVILTFYAAASILRRLTASPTRP